MFSYLKSFFVVVLVLPYFASAQGLSWHAGELLRRHAQGRSLPTDQSGDVKSGVFQQLINPQDVSDMRTFNQNYFVNSSYASGPNAPVILYICGEATCSAGQLSGAVADHARNLKAHLVALEHRYYGHSQPFPTLTTENLKYLTTDNALTDLARFETWAKTNLGLKGPWLVTGGSYAGALSAYYRFKYPNMVVGSLASSAPVQAHENFLEYDMAVAKGAGPECNAKIQQVVKIAEAALDNPADLAKYKEMFGASDVQDNLDFLWVVAEMSAIAVQYGYRDELCNSLQNATDLMESYSSEGKRLFSMMGMTPALDTPQAAMSLDPADYLDGWGMRQWTYQSCTEYGFWQIANPDSQNSSRSSLLNIDYFHKVCDRVFGIKTPAAEMQMNTEFYEPIRAAGKTSQIIFVNGGNDPWAQLSISKERGNSNNPNLDLFTVAGGAHCDDLGFASTSTSAVGQAQVKTLNDFKTWLKAN